MDNQDSLLPSEMEKQIEEKIKSELSKQYDNLDRSLNFPPFVDMAVKFVLIPTLINVGSNLLIDFVKERIKK